MRSFVPRIALAALSTLSLLSGCAENTPEILILQNLRVDENCRPPASASGDNVLARGVLDLFVTNQYLMVPIVQNTLVPSNSVSFGRGGRGQGLTGNEWEANDITFSRATVELDIPPSLDAAFARSFEIPISGTVRPGGSQSVELYVILPAIGNALAQSNFLRTSGSRVTMLARVQFIGKTNAGREVDSNIFTFPIELCVGCLLDTPAAAVDPTFPSPNCRNVTGLDDTSLTDVCFPGQDQRLDCRLVCPNLGPDEEDPSGSCRPN